MATVNDLRRLVERAINCAALFEQRNLFLTLMSLGGLQVTAFDIAMHLKQSEAWKQDFELALEATAIVLAQQPFHDVSAVIAHIFSTEGSWFCAVPAAQRHEQRTDYSYDNLVRVQALCCSLRNPHSIDDSCMTHVGNGIRDNLLTCMFVAKADENHLTSLDMDAIYASYWKATENDARARAWYYLLFGILGRANATEHLVAVTA